MKATQARKIMMEHSQKSQGALPSIFYKIERNAKRGGSYLIVSDGFLGKESRTKIIKILRQKGYKISLIKSKGHEVACYPISTIGFKVSW